MRRNIFISYSTKDDFFADSIFQKLTGYLEDSQRIFKSGESIKPGQDWESVIDDAIQDARVALFLVSDNSRNSDYIPTEIKRVIDQAQSDHRLEIRWLKTSEIGLPPELEPYQGYFKGRSLSDMQTGERDRRIDEVARSLVDLLGQDAGMRDAFEIELGTLVKRNFGLHVRRRIMRGENSIVFRANGPGFLRVVKGRVLTTDIHDQRQRASLIEARKALVADLRHPAFIRFVDGLVDKGLQVMVEDYLAESRPLNKHPLMRGETGLPLDRVRQTLATLAEALAEFHKTGGTYGNLQSDDVFVERTRGCDWKVRIHAVRMSAIERDLWHHQEGERRKFRLKDLQSFAPEQFKDPTPTQATDQYALGLLGIEMLQGAPPVRVGQISDLAEKVRFFDDPVAYPGRWQARSPRLTRILARMLSRDPKDRYKSIGNVVRALNVSGSIADDNRKIAKQSYRRLTDRGAWTEVLADFYGRYLTARPDLRRHFDKAFPAAETISPDAPQITKLGRAVLYLLNFTVGEFEEPTTLTDYRDSHADFGLTSDDIDQFVDELLAALGRASEDSEEVQDAWRETISPGIAYMKGCTTQAVPV
jgi:hypothetical protein